MAWSWQDIKDITLSPRLNFKQFYNKVRNNLYYLKESLTGLNWQEPIKDRDLSTPPGSPSEGDRYIVKATGTGDWAGHDNDITEYNGSSWEFIAEDEGMACYCDDEDIFIYFDGTNWVKLASGVGVVTQEKVEKDDTEAQTWDNPLTSLKSNLNRIRHQIVAITGEAWGTVSHSIVDVWAKFHATTGHKHTGGADDAPKLDAANTHENVSTDTHHNELHDTDKHTNLEYDSASSSGLNFYYKAGRVRNDNAITNVSAEYVTLADDDTSYVEVSENGTVSSNTTGFTSGKIPLYQVTTASGAITDVTDKRTWQACRSVPAVPIHFRMKWGSGETYYQHFNIRIGIGTSPEGGSYIVDKESKDNQTDWVYFSPDNLVSIPSGGVDYLHDGLRAQYTVPAETLARGIIYNVWKRAYNVDDSIYGDWNWLGSISL